MSEITRKAAYVRMLYQQGLKFPAWSKDRTAYHTESMWNFCNWFLPKPFPYKWFHKEWMRIACGQQWFCVLAPRDHSKSTSFGAGYPLWRLCMDPSNTIMLVSGTATVAELQLRVIKESLEANQLLIEGFGLLVPEEKTKWTNSEIIIQRQAGIAHPSVVALGAGSAILSRRAKFIIADDIVRDDEVGPEQRAKLKAWVNGVLVGVLEAEDQIGFIGTKKHHADFYAELEASPQYYYQRYDAIQREIPPANPNDPEDHGSWETLWPEKWPEKELRVRMAIQGTFQFNQNYRNISMGEDDSPFPMTWLKKCQDATLRFFYRYPYDDFVKKVISVDLALGDKDGNGSYFVAMVTALRQDGDFLILHITRERLDFPAQVKKLSELIVDFAPNAVVVESNAYQGAMTSTIAAAHPGLEVVPHQTGRNKHDPVEGIPMLQPLAEAGRLHFPYQDDDGRVITDVVCEELNRLGVARHSDTVMALWFGVKYLSPFVVLTSRRSVRATIL